MSDRPVNSSTCNGDLFLSLTDRSRKRMQEEYSFIGKDVQQMEEKRSII